MVLFSVYFFVEYINKPPKKKLLLSSNFSYLVGFSHSFPVNSHNN